MPTAEELVRDNPVTLTQYLRLVALAVQDNPSWRKGQAYFNVLANVRPDLSEQIRGTDIDPFYTDCNLPAFLAQVSICWNNDIANEVGGNDAE